jgi:hypothetical protein
MRKGNLVKLNPATCFTVQNGGNRRFVLTNGLNDDQRTVEGTRLANVDDVSAWRDSDASKGIDCAGETKLPPTAFSVPVYADRVYHLVRARCRPQWSYRSHPGMACILDTETGHELYVKRELLEVIS